MLTRIAIADDHPLVLLGTRIVIEAGGQHRVVAEARCAESLLAILAEEPVDLVVTDFSMPDVDRSDGQAMLQALSRNYPKVPVILVTMVTNATTLNMAMRTGVRGLVWKCSCVDGTRKAVDTVLSGGIYLDPSWRTACRRVGVSDRFRCCRPRSWRFCGCMCRDLRSQRSPGSCGAPSVPSAGNAFRR